MKYLTHIKISLQLFISALIGIEVSILPNPYIEPLICLLLIYIALKYNIPDKSITSLKRLTQGLTKYI